ncbi:MAG: TolC family protein [Bacteroidetes bacterium]|nr:TolC family protein [Bacteroidota bacterium]
MKRAILLLSILMYYSFAGWAQKSPWTFQQCLDTALKRNISVNQSRLSNELSRINLEQSRANRIPSVSASVGESYNIGKNVDATTNQFVIGTFHSGNYGLNANYNLFNGLQNNNTIKQYKLNIEAGNYDIENAKNAVILSVTTGYLQILQQYEILKIAQNQLVADSVQVDRTQKMLNVGKAAEGDLLQIQSQLATDYLSFVNAQNQLDIARVTLMQLMQIPVIDNFDVEVPNLVEPGLVLLQSKEEIYQISLAAMPQIQSSSIRTKSSLMAVKIAAGARWPRLTLTGGLSSNYASSRKQGVLQENYPWYSQVWDNVGQSFNLGLSIPIFSNRQLQSSIERARINAKTAELNDLNTRQTLRMNIEQTYTSLKAAARNFDATKIQLKSTEMTYKNAEKKFNVGVMSATDYLIQKNNYTSSLSNAIQTKYNFIFQSKILDFYQGKAITF